MRIMSGTFNGTGAAVYLCLGFVPDRFELVALEDADEARLIWDREMLRTAEMVAGLRYVGSGGATQQAPLTVGTGVQPYFGGDTLSTANQTSTTYGEGVYLARDANDYRYLNSLAPGNGVGDAADETINAWTLDTSANRTGRFNSDVTGTYISEGSRIIINGEVYTIQALTAGQGVSADEVTLNQAAATGTVDHITGMYTWAPIAIGNVTPRGIKIDATSELNVNDEIQAFTAYQYDN